MQSISRSAIPPRPKGLTQASIWWQRCKTRAKQKNSRAVIRKEAKAMPFLQLADIITYYTFSCLRPKHDFVNYSDYFPEGRTKRNTGRSPAGVSSLACGKREPSYVKTSDTMSHAGHHLTGKSKAKALSHARSLRSLESTEGTEEKLAEVEQKQRAA